MEVLSKLTAHKAKACVPSQEWRTNNRKIPERSSCQQTVWSKCESFYPYIAHAGICKCQPYKILEGLNIPISNSTIQNILDDGSQKTADAAVKIRDRVAQLNVIHCDETGVDINGKLNWLHCLCNSEWSYCKIHEKRGITAMDEIGVIPSLDGCTLIHDFWTAYLKYHNVRHGFCNTHLERELIYAYESTGQKWAMDLNDLLSEMCGRKNGLMKDGQPAFSADALAEYLLKYDRLVNDGLEKNRFPMLRPVKKAERQKVKPDACSKGFVLQRGYSQIRNRLEYSVHQ